MLILLLTALSVWISTSIVFGYIAWRLFVLVRADGRAGIWQWLAETKKRFRRPGKEVEGEERPLTRVGGVGQGGHQAVP